MAKIKAHWWILIALVLGVLAGLITRELEIDRLVAFYDLLGKLFLNALKMIIVPLIFSSIAVAIAGLGTAGGFGKLGLKTVGYYLMTTFFAVIIGLTMVNTVKPGLVDGKPSPAIQEYIEKNRKDFESRTEARSTVAEEKGLGVVAEIFERMIPQNIFSAASNNGAMLSLIFLSLLTGFAVPKLSEAARKPLLDLLVGLNELMLLVTRWIMLLAPIGVFGLIALAVAETGVELFRSLALYFVTVLAALSIHIFLVLPLLLFFLGRVNPLHHFIAMKEALLTAFSTASSSGTLPVTMRCVSEEAGVSKRVTTFVLPLGATVNMDGTALYECIAVLFVAQVLGVSMDVGEQFIIVLLALLTSIGVAGVPSASLVAIVIIINNVGIEGSAAAIGALYAVDRLLDMSRTAVNVFSDSCGAVIIAKSEGEDQVLAG